MKEITNYSDLKNFAPQYYDCWFGPFYNKEAIEYHLEESIFRNILTNLGTFIESTDTNIKLEYIYSFKDYLKDRFLKLSDEFIRDFDASTLKFFIDFIGLNINKLERFHFIKKNLNPDKYVSLELSEIYNIITSCKDLKHYKLIVPIKYGDEETFISKTNIKKLFDIDHKRRTIRIKFKDYPENDIIITYEESLN